MKRLFFLTAAMMLSIMLSAQTQQGYVKTKGRLDSNGNLIPGQGLKGATVSVRGRTAVLVNADDGAFSFPVPETQFRIDSVRKKGYQLVDLDVLSKTYNHSANPIYFVMETPEQQLQDKLTAEKKIRRNLQKQLQDKEDEIENLKKQQKITDEEYRLALQKLYQDQENNEQLISNMAKRYSELDYDQLDEFYRQVSFYIENGELLKADSALKTRGDLPAQVDDILHRGQVLQEEKEQLQKAEAVQQADIEEAAQRCYSYFETFAAQHLNDTAAYYLDLRTTLDTTNFYWQIDAAHYNVEIIGDFEKALSYCHRAVNSIIAQYGDKDIKLAPLYNNMADIYRMLGNYSKAIELVEKALSTDKISENVEGIHSYSTMGLIYSEQSQFEKALDAYNNAIVFANSLDSSSKDSFLGDLYGNMGLLHMSMANFSEAMQYFFKSSDLIKKTRGQESPMLSPLYINLGSLYLQQSRFSETIMCCDSALTIMEGNLSKGHPYFSYLYNLKGVTYGYLGNNTMALEYAHKALEIQERIYGKYHPNNATAYNNIGFYYNNLGDYSKALDSYNTALEIMGNSSGFDNPTAAMTYNNIGIIYGTLEDLEKALEFHEKALTIREKLYGIEHPDVAMSNNNIGLIFIKQGEYDKAYKYCKKALDIWIASLGEDNTNVATAFCNIGLIYNKTGEFQKAINHYQKALNIQEKIYGANHPNIAVTNNNLGEAYYSQHNYVKAREYYSKALEMWKQSYGENHSKVAMAYYNIGSTCSDDLEALEYCNKALSIWESTLGEDHSDTKRAKNRIAEIQAKLKEQENEQKN